MALSDLETEVVALRVRVIRVENSTIQREYFFFPSLIFFFFLNDRDLICSFSNELPNISISDVAF